METSKRLVYLVGMATILLIIACAFGAQLAEITIAAIGAFTTICAFYLWKAKNENRAKYAQKFMEKWAEKYGTEAVVQITEIVTRD